jgi:hypothetical protein
MKTAREWLMMLHQALSHATFGGRRRARRLDLDAR